jgi:hypothetical protein
MTVPLGLNSFLPPNILMNKAEGSCLDLSGKEENKSDSNKDWNLEILLLVGMIEEKDYGISCAFVN